MEETAIVTLTEFLNARLDEDEAAAKAVHDESPPWPGQWEADGNHALRTYNGWVLATAGTPGSEFRPGVLAHLARHDPARVLREVEAGRQLLADYEKAAARRGSRFAAVVAQALYAQVANRARVYIEHPDYRLEWRTR